MPVTVTRIHLADRTNSNDGINGGTLTFSDGSEVEVPALPNDGALNDIGIVPRTVSWVRFTVDSVSDETANVGLAEFEVLGLSANQAPRANAGPGRSVVGGTTVQLDGSASRDLEQDVLTYQWQQTGGPAVTLSNATAMQPTFVAPAGPATLDFTLVVSDGHQNSALVSTTLTVLSAQDDDSNGLADAWESLYGVSDPLGDPDHDGLTNLQEHDLGSHPTDAAPAARSILPAPPPIPRTARSAAPSNGLPAWPDRSAPAPRCIKHSPPAPTPSPPPSSTARAPLQSIFPVARSP
jgi:hypothetical protein